MHARSFLCGMLAAVSLGGAAAVAQNTSLDELVVATVNGENITRRQLVSRLLEFYGEDSLQKMVNRMLLVQAAKKAAVEITDAETDKKLEEIKKQFRKPEEFGQWLTQNGLTEKQYREEVRHTLILEKVAIKESPVTDTDLQQYETRMIIASSKPEAEKLVKELEGGADFGKMATEKSLDPAGKQAGGRIRPFIKIELLDVWRALDEQKVQKGGFTKTPVLLTDTSWAIIKLENIVPISAASATEKERLTTLVTRYRMDQWLNQNRMQAKVTFPVPITAVIGEKQQ